jgi:hypothetical protein
MAILQSRLSFRCEPAPGPTHSCSRLHTQQVSGQSRLDKGGTDFFLFRMHRRAVIRKHFDSRHVLPFRQRELGDMQAFSVGGYRRHVDGRAPTHYSSVARIMGGGTILVEVIE